MPENSNADQGNADQGNEDQGGTGGFGIGTQSGSGNPGQGGSGGNSFPDVFFLIQLGPFQGKMTTLFTKPTLPGVIIDISRSTVDQSLLAPGAAEFTAITDNSGHITIAVPMRHRLRVRATYPAGTFDITQPSFTAVISQDIYT